MDSFEGKVAVITGGGNGIGRALARELAGRGGKAVPAGNDGGALARAGGGCKLVLADIDGDAVAGAVADLPSAGADVVSTSADVTKLADVEALAATAIERFGHVDIVVNNAGVIAWNPVSALTIADWEW